ncbi:MULTISPECIES: hypothetical protein [unclassified Thiocapsa]|uniref:hypothetical protein n=1 Tax=unclassified Thiocapsa TaxID=2641286 RepID=UPI0035B03072
MERRHEAQNEGDGGGIDLVIFNLGTLRFAVDSALIQGVADPTGTPDARAPSLADLLGLARGSSTASAHTPGSRERLLRFRHTLQDGASVGAQSPGVRIEEPVWLLRAPVDAIHPLPALLEALSKLPCVLGLVTVSTTNADDLAILLDPRRLPEEGCKAPSVHATRRQHG